MERKTKNRNNGHLGIYMKKDMGIIWRCEKRFSIKKGIDKILEEMKSMDETNFDQ